MSDIERKGDVEHDTGGDEPLRIEFIGVRGGQGTSTVAAATALILGETHRRVYLEVGDPEAAAALVGRAVADDMPTRLTETVALMTAVDRPTAVGSSVLVTDRGTIESTSEGIEPSPTTLQVGVLRGPCYVALRTLVGLDTALWAGLVIVAEAGRALDRRDVEDITGLTVLATVEVSPAVARNLDAGLAIARLAKMREYSQVRQWLSTLASGPAYGLDRGALDAVAFRSEPVEITCTDWHLPPMAEGAARGCPAITVSSGAVRRATDLSSPGSNRMRCARRTARLCGLGTTFGGQSRTPFLHSEAGVTVIITRTWLKRCLGKGCSPAEPPR